MKRLLLSALVCVVGALGYLPLKAQTGAAESVITITPNVSPSSSSEPVTLNLSITGEAPITLEGTSDPYSSDRSSYTLTADNVVIKGKVTGIDCSYSEKLGTIDCSASTTIESIKAKYCPIKSVLVSGCKTLKTVEVSGNGLTAVDLTGCTNLEKLMLSGSINLSKVTLNGCTALKEAELQNCNLTTVDLSGLTNLKNLNLSKNKLTALSLKGLTKLESFECTETELTSMDLSACSLLNLLTLSSNKSLTNVVLPQTDKLQFLYMQGNALTELSLSNLSSLKEAYLEKNKLTKLTITNCPKLQKLGVYFNALKEEALLDLVKGLADFSAEGSTISGSIFANGIKIDYTEANKWSAKSIALAKAKGWEVYTKNEDSYEPPYPTYPYAKVTIAPTTNGTIALKGFEAKELNTLPEGFDYTIVATPDEGYKLQSVKINDKEVTDYTFNLTADTKIEASFEPDGAKSGYDYYLIGISNTKKSPKLKVYKYGYDADKRWISRSENSADGTLVTRNDIHYNEKGQISSIDFTLGGIDKDNKPSQTAQFTYNDEGQITHRKMLLFDKDLADCDIFYRPDGQKDYWYDKIGGLGHIYTYNENDQLTEEKEGAPDDPEAKRPEITNPMAKIFYTYADNGALELIQTSTRTNNWRYINGLRLAWNGDGAIASIKGLNYIYSDGATEASEGEEAPMFELKYIYDDTHKDANVFWPRLPFTEGNGGELEFPYYIEGYCSKAEYWGLSSGTPNHFIDIVYTFEASPVQAQKLEAMGAPSVRYANGLLFIEGSDLQAVRLYDMNGNICINYTTNSCQRIDMGVGSVPSGSYIVQVINGQSASTVKILIP